MTLAHNALARIIDTCQPETLVTCGKIAENVGKHWQAHNNSVALITLDPDDPNTVFPLSQTQDLALISETLEHLSHKEGALLLGQLRNYGTHQIAVVIAEDRNWQFNDFIALGFQRQAELADDSHLSTLYTYNIDTYNHKRAWNNPDHWANPEMWGKAWW